MNTNGSISLDVRQENIHESAIIRGQCRITGERTRIGPGVIIEDSCLEDVIVEEGAIIKDSVLVSSGPEPRKIERNSFYDRWAIQRDHTSVGKNSKLNGCTATNTPIGNDCVLEDCSFTWGRLENNITLTDCVVLGSWVGDHVRVKGPAELCSGRVGHHFQTDRPAYYQGVFSNDFYVIEFDKQTGLPRIAETLDIPHVSRHGRNMIVSGNSGRLAEQPDQILTTMGEKYSYWNDAFQIYEKAMQSPMCWVSGWTKVVGKSPTVPDSAEAMLADTLFTYLMPMSASGLNGEAVMGQVMSGEQCSGYSHKQREAAWIFTYAPGAVFNMVRRLHEASGDKELSDNIVKMCLKNALAMTRYWAHRRNLDLDNREGASKRGWTGWLVSCNDQLEQHLASGLWDFSDGEPTGWIEKDGTWTPRDSSLLLKIAKDALANQQTEEDLLRCDEPEFPRQLGIRPDSLADTLQPAHIDDTATVAESAEIGPGVQVLGDSVVEDGALLYRTILRNSRVGANTTLMRSVVENSDVGESSQAISSLFTNLKAGDNCNFLCSVASDSTLAHHSRMDAYGCVKNSTALEPCIIGNTTLDSEIRSIHMAYHMPGHMEHGLVVPTKFTVKGNAYEVLANPMMGGGCRVMGTADNKAVLECGFYGSNTILEGGSYTGFGSFVTGRLKGDEGLLPFTVSTAPGPMRDQIGGVIYQMPHVIVSHFLAWAYFACKPDQLDALPLLIRAKLQEGVDAIDWALAQKDAGSWDEASPFAKYKSMKAYNAQQLESGRDTYMSQLEDDRWEMEYVNNELKFAGTSGTWHTVGGYLRWEPAGE